MKKIITIVILGFFSENLANAQYLVSCTYVNYNPSLVLSAITGLALDYDVDMYKMIYNTVDINGQPTIASGAFLVPTNTNCADFPIATYNHGTTLKKMMFHQMMCWKHSLGRFFRLEDILHVCQIT